MQGQERPVQRRLPRSRSLRPFRERMMLMSYLHPTKTHRSNHHSKTNSTSLNLPKLMPNSTHGLPYARFSTYFKFDNHEWPIWKRNNRMDFLCFHAEVRHAVFLGAIRCAGLNIADPQCESLGRTQGRPVAARFQHALEVIQTGGDCLCFLDIACGWRALVRPDDFDMLHPARGAGQRPIARGPA